MGLLDKLLGRKDERPMVREGNSLTLRRREIAGYLKRPVEPNFTDDPQPPCDTCQQELDEVFITTGGPLGDEEVWRDVPVAVDGWACVGCGVFRYPRKVTPEEIVAWSDEGVAHGKAGRFAEAELAFTRVAWSWPGYVAGHVNLAEATRDRLRLTSDRIDDRTRRLLTRRLVDEYEAAIAGYEAKPQAAVIPAVVRACTSVAEIAIGERAFDRARRALATCLALDGLGADDRTRAEDLLDAIATRRDLFAAAAAVLMPRIGLTDRPARPPTTPEERKAVADALDQIAEHAALAPDRWQAAWLRAKGLLLVGKDAEAFAVFADAFTRLASAPPDLGRDYSFHLLEAGRHADARDVGRILVERVPTDATLWCNLAVAELLSGDLDAAERAAARSRALDPADPVEQAVSKRLAGYRAGKPLPRSMADLQRG